ncbi:hypothetical protein NHQ30_005582 [Ciborinia camelliae]|nr:hypothetical protein NHQ30_005582 [Ciborinia camelliae]
MDSNYSVSSVILLLLVAALTLSVIWRLWFKTSQYPFPPSPPGEPILGHIRLVPTEDPHLYYQKLSQEHIAFGITLQNDDDEYIKISADATNATGNGGSPGATVVDYFPFLGIFPYWLVPSKAIKHAKKWSSAIKRLHDIPFAASRKDFNDGVAQKSSYVHPLLERHAQNESQGLPNGFSMEDINGSAAAIFIAGSDTTLATTLVGILNLLLHPSIFCKARNLLDQTIGPDRLPSLKDRDNPKLLYIEYIVQELVRWRPLSPLGVPHKSLNDDIYNEMFIPRGTNVYFNTWAMSRDQDVYKDPDQFNPDRYVPVEQGGLGEPYLKGPFGFGRRICVGRHLALASVWIVLATLISTVDISKAVDLDGKDIEPVVGFTTASPTLLVEIPGHVPSAPGIAPESFGPDSK